MELFACSDELQCFADSLLLFQFMPHTLRSLSRESYRWMTLPVENHIRYRHEYISCGHWYFQ